MKKKWLNLKKINKSENDWKLSLSYKFYYLFNLIGT